MLRHFAISRAFFVLAAVSLCLSGRVTNAQMGFETARSLGLEVAWRAHVQVPFNGKGLASTNFWVDSANQEQFAQVKLENRTFRVSANQLGRDGKAIGIEGAKKAVSIQAGKYLGKPTGFQVDTVSVPKVYLVVVTGNGLVQNFDAETGKLLWSAPCGNTFEPAFPAALCKKGVAVIHGTNLYFFDWATGKQMKQVRARSRTSNAIAIAGGVGFASDYVGNVTSYALGTDSTPWSYVMNGRAVGQPVSFADQQFCAIASDAGYAYVFTFEKTPKVWMRYETNSSISGSLAAGNNAIYVGTTGGTISKVTAESRLGSIAWEYRASDPINRPALVDGDNVFVSTETGNLISIKDSSAGVANWSVPAHVSSVLGVTSDRVYGVTFSNRIVAFDKATGQRVATTAPFDFGHAIVNSSTNRIYIVTRDGRLECLRPIGSELPEFIVPVAPVDPAEKPATAAPAANPNAQPAGNIFGPAAPAAGGADVFNADPFSGGAGDDPFSGGAGDDPFATGDGDPFGDGGL
ncbi:MAG: hypothetical protein Aurels2KO_28420 [Aureliella sp.]